MDFSYFQACPLYKSTAQSHTIPMLPHRLEFNYIQDVAILCKQPLRMSYELATAENIKSVVSALCAVYILILNMLYQCTWYMWC